MPSSTYYDSRYADIIHETKKFSADDGKQPKTMGSGDVAGNFVPQFSSRNRIRPITNSNEPRLADK